MAARREIGNHVPQVFVLRCSVGDNHHILLSRLCNRGQDRLIHRLFPCRRLGGLSDKQSVFAGENQLVKVHPRLLPALFGEQVVHICGKPAHHLHAQIKAVFLHIAMGGHIVKMLGGGDLGGKLAGQIDAVRLDELDQPVQLVRRNKGVDRITEQNQVGLFQRLAHQRKILFIAFDPLSHRQKAECMFWMQRLQIERCVDGRRVFSLWTCV